MRRIFALILVFSLAVCIFSSCGEDACEHRGGIATCISQAECSLCGSEYGEENADNHFGKTEWIMTQTTHEKIYGCCDVVVESSEAHDWKLGRCQECLYTCDHADGVANCTSKAVCANCGAYYGEKDPLVHSGEAGWVSDASSHKSFYTCCSFEEVPIEAHQWQGGFCVDCGYECLHKGGKATCQSKAVCEICGHLYGELDPDAHEESACWEILPATHVELYPCCLTMIVDEQPHMFLDGTCSQCRYNCYHSGGEATCVNRAICVDCKSAYGEKNPLNHVGTKEYNDTLGQYEYTCCGRGVVG